MAAACSVNQHQQMERLQCLEPAAPRYSPACFPLQSSEAYFSLGISFLWLMVLLPIVWLRLAIAADVWGFEALFFRAVSQGLHPDCDLWSSAGWSIAIAVTERPPYFKHYCNYTLFSKYPVIGCKRRQPIEYSHSGFLRLIVTFSLWKMKEVSRSSDLL